MYYLPLELMLNITKWLMLQDYHNFRASCRRIFATLPEQPTLTYHSYRKATIKYGYKLSWGRMVCDPLRTKSRMNLDYDEVNDESFGVIATYGHSYEIIRILLSSRASAVSETVKLKSCSLLKLEI